MTDADPHGPALRLVESHGWDVHHAVHERFGDFLSRMAGIQQTDEVLMWIVPLRHNLHHHLRFEDDVVLPLAGKLLPHPPPNGTVATFLEDHRLIRERLDRLFDHALQSCHRPVDRAVLLECLAVLDDLLEHHDQRETEHLYGPLGEVLDEASRGDLLQRVAATPLVTAPQCAEWVSEWTGAGLLRSACRDYADWVVGNDPRPPDEDAKFLAALGSAAPKLGKLRNRDARLVRDYRARTPPTPLERWKAWRRVEQTLRTTVRFTLEAAFQNRLNTSG